MSYGIRVFGTAPFGKRLSYFGLPCEVPTPVSGTRSTKSG
jgi:hypothetical protein